MRRRAQDAKLAEDLLEAHPLATLLVDARLRIAYANAAARRILGATAGSPLGAALGCSEGKGRCGEGTRCGGCALRRATERALAGERSRARGFVLRAGEGGTDLHLLAVAAPFARGRRAHALLALDDATEIASDPRILEVCGGCGRIADEEGGWHRLDRYLEDRLGVEPAGPCQECAGRLGV